MLSPKLKETYQFIQGFIQKESYAPTMAEIAEGIGIKSRGVVHRYVQSLAKEGYLSIVPGKRRNIRLVENTMEVSFGVSPGSIPLLGKIAAGRPIEAISTPQTIDIASLLLGANRYALKVQGDSMVDEGILDGDLIVCEHTETAENGEIVVALIDSETVTLKQFYNNRDGTITLRPANPTLQPIVYLSNRITLQGIMVGLLRLAS